MYVSVCVCVSVCEHIFGTVHPVFNFCACLTMAMSQSFSGGIAISCVLLSVWMMSYLHIMAMNRRKRHSQMTQQGAAGFGIAMNT